MLQPRDGRQLRKEGKAKNIMCMTRFLQKGTGLLGKSMDKSLESLGLGMICPSHHQRLLGPSSIQMLQKLYVQMDMAAEWCSEAQL